MKNDQLQSPMPSFFTTPPLVQPSWHLSDLKSLKSHPKKQLEQKLCQEYGVKYCLLLDSARSGIYLLSKTLSLKGEWLSTSFNYRPTAVLMKSLTSSISFADIKDDFTMDPDSAASLVNSNTEVIYATHMFGKSADVTQLRALADKKGLFLIENAVHLSNGHNVDGVPLGGWGDATLLSFNLDKPIGGLLGGALLTNREDVWHAITSVSLKQASHSIITNRVISSFIGHTLKPYLSAIKNKVNPNNSNLIKETLSFPLDAYQTYTPKMIHSIQASIAASRLSISSNISNTRIQNAHHLNLALDPLESLQLPLSTISQPHSYMYYPLQFPSLNRYKLAQHYSQHGIETKWRYYPLHLQRDFSDSKYNSLEKTDSLWNKYLLLPIGHKMTTNNIDYIAEVTNKYIVNSCTNH